MSISTTLFSMIKRNDVPAIRRWLDSGNDVNTPDAQLGSLLNVAAMLGHLELVELLIESGAQLECLDADGDSPLFAAVANNHTEVARRLLQAGAKLTYVFQRPKTVSEWTRLTHAQDGFRSLIDDNTAKAQVRAGVGQAPPEMRESIEKIQTEIFDDLGTDWFAPQEKHVVEDCEHFPMLQMLGSEFGADINRVNSCGEWPLLRFAQLNDVVAVRWLLENGALVDQTSTGETALFSALQVNNLEMLTLLIDAGANVNQRDCDQCVPLHCSQSIAATELLLARGADPTLRDQADFPCWHFVRRPDVRKHMAAQAAAWKPQP